jgi:hypothetical protein
MRALFLSLVPGFVQRMIRRRRMDIELDRAVRRLAETSPHLLQDIGIPGGAESGDAAPNAAGAQAEVVMPAAHPQAPVAVNRAFPAIRPVVTDVPASLRRPAHA